MTTGAVEQLALERFASVLLQTPRAADSEVVIYDIRRLSDGQLDRVHVLCIKKQAGEISVEEQAEYEQLWQHTIVSVTSDQGVTALKAADSGGVQRADASEVTGRSRTVRIWLPDNGRSAR
jgi:hypothetical protein